MKRKQEKNPAVRSDSLAALDFIEVKFECEWPLEIVFDEGT
jgi:hypothetical protein